MFLLGRIIRFLCAMLLRMEYSWIDKFLKEQCREQAEHRFSLGCWMLFPIRFFVLCCAFWVNSYFLRRKSSYAKYWSIFFEMGVQSNQTLIDFLNISLIGKKYYYLFIKRHFELCITIINLLFLSWKRWVVFIIHRKWLEERGW